MKHCTSPKWTICQILLQLKYISPVNRPRINAKLEHSIFGSPIATVLIVSRCLNELGMYPLVVKVQKIVLHACVMLKILQT